MVCDTGLYEPDPEEPILRYLIDLPGVFMPHSGLTLFHHLLGTYRILKRWNAEEDVSRAGLFHSVYGTPAFTKGLLTIDRRHELAAVIGASAEALVYVFSGLCWGKILAEGETGLARIADPLVLLAAANLVEQCGRLTTCDRVRETEALTPYLLLVPRLQTPAAFCVTRKLRPEESGHEGPV